MSQVKLEFLDKNENSLKILNLNLEDIYKRKKRLKGILDFALDNNVDNKWGCMGGSCSACICEVIEGLEYLNREGLHEIVYKDVKPNQILTCITTIKEEAFNQEKEVSIKVKLLL